MLKVARLCSIALVPVLFSCGGSNSSGSGSGGNGPGASITAKFIDAPVKGLGFKGAKSGTTSAGGKFSCKRGESLEFSIKGLALGKANCTDAIYVDELTDDSATSTGNAAAAIIQAFSQSSGGELDLSKFNESDANVGSITLSDLQDVDETAYTSTLKSKIQSVIDSASNLPSDLEVPADMTAVRAHVDQSLPDLSDDTALQAMAAIYNGDTANINSYITIDSDSGNHDECWRKASYLLKVEPHGDKTFKFRVLRYVGHDEGVDPSQIGSCTNSGTYDCEANPAPEKVIVSKNIKIANYSVIEETLTPQTHYWCTDGNEIFFQGEQCASGEFYANLDKTYNLSVENGLVADIAITNSAISVDLEEMFYSGMAVEDSYTGGSAATMAMKLFQVKCNYSGTVQL